MSAPAGTLDPPAAAPPDPRVPAFAVGDFVWGKIKHHPWWPGQVYDPSHASDRARSAHRRDRSLLVAYFGDSSFAWCDPSQLKPFTAAEFPDMAHRQNAAKTSLAAAVDDALNAVGKRLQHELTCPCVAPAELELELKGTCPVSNYAPAEFLERLRDAARDALSVDMLEATMMLSWGSAFAKGSFSDGSFAYRPRREVAAADLVRNDIDFDALNLDLFGEEVDGDVPWSTGSGNVKTPEEKLYRSRKKRSTGKFTEESEEAVETRSGMTEEETGSGMGRRERKKSKYLSPPYTLTSESTEFSGSSKVPELKSPKKETGVSWPLRLESPKRSGFSSNVLQEGDKKSPVLKIYSNPAIEILSEFLSTAINPLHLKGNRSAKTVIGFFAAYRSSLYANGSDFDAYKNKKHLSFCGSIDGKSANIVTVDRDEDESLDGMKRGANGETLSDLGHNTTDGSGQLKTGLKRKARNEIDDGMSPFDFSQDATNHSLQGKTKSKRKMRNDGAAEGTPFGVLPDATMGSVTQAGSDGTELKGKTRKYSNKGEAMLDWDLQITNGPERRRTPHKRKKSKDKMRQKMIKGKLGRKRGKDGPSGKSLVDMQCGVTNVMGKSGRGMKRKDVTTYKGPVALVLTFAPGITLPSKEQLISTFGQYGDLIEADTELKNESGSARVVFSKSSDAEKALKSRNRSRAFGSPVPSYHLYHLPGNVTSVQITMPKPPLLYARKSLERIISTLSGSSSSKKGAGSADGLKPEMRENLIGDMRGLLKKVNKMLSAPAAGVS